jgi:prevent-host-death family protein
VKATLTELHRETKKVVRPVIQGQEVQLTEHGRPVARLKPDFERVVVSEEEMRKMEFTDEAILEAIREARS